MNTNDSASFKVVKVLNNFIKSERKRKWRHINFKKINKLIKN
jgi:hypothetical protein